MCDATEAWYKKFAVAISPHSFNQLFLLNDGIMLISWFIDSNDCLRIMENHFSDISSMTIDLVYDSRATTT